MSEKLILSVLVENKSGALQRVASLFSRRGYNIKSLTVSETEDTSFSRMTIVTEATSDMTRQIEMQLIKLEIVKKVEVITRETAVSSELLLIKVRAKGDAAKNTLLELNLKYGSRVRDFTSESVTIELTGRPETVDEFIAVVSEFGIIELARTGLTSLERGADSFSDDVKE